MNFIVTVCLLKKTIKIIRLLLPLSLKFGGVKHLPLYPSLVFGSSRSGNMSHMATVHCSPFSAITSRHLVA